MIEKLFLTVHKDNFTALVSEKFSEFLFRFISLLGECLGTLLSSEVVEYSSNSFYCIDYIIGTKMSLS